MASPAEETTIVRLLELLGQINTGDELISWVEQDLQPTLAHGAFICGMGKVQRSGVSPIKFFASNFPVDYLRALKQPDGYIPPAEAEANYYRQLAEKATSVAFT
jgi:hypothetical protein